MPLLLTRYMLGDLLRVGILATGVLVTVTAFGAAIKPLANDDLVSATQTAKYVALAIVPMLQFALPFAFAFAATLVMHRMTADNEILAASVTGISYGRILTPVAGLGIVLALAMVLLTQSLIPKFWALMQRTLADDVTQLFESSIRRGVPFELGDLQIYADKLIVDHDPDGPADTRFILFNAVAAETDKDGGIVSDVTARQMVADLYRQDGRRFVKLVLTDTVGYNGRSGELGGAPLVEPRRAIEIPDAFKHQPAFMSREELLHLREHPEDYHSVRQAANRLALALREQVVWDRMARQLAEGKPVEMVVGTERRYLFHGDRVSEGQMTAADDRPVKVEEFHRGELVRWFESPGVALRRAEDDLSGGLTFEAILSDPKVLYPRAHGENESDRRVLASLEFPGSDDVDWLSLTIPQLLERASASPPGGLVADQAARVQRKLDELRLEITSRLHRRYAMSATAPLLLLLGAALAMLLRNSLPLAVFLWVFLPAILGVMFLSGGGQIVKDGHQAVGLAVLWSGNGLLGLFLAGVFFRLIRN